MANSAIHHNRLY
ncbi:unnamed protein product [Cuscuta europaea]|uniref:Uncharacterized protein n=1 Tax=Cuscuta europaea TaxID=41803 RepID=A0A9P0ZBN3_CUSEU|nr:unnamed protein product [Cuscuta europaea]